MLQKSFFAVCIIWAACFVLHIGFGWDPNPLVWVCGLTLGAWAVYFGVMLLIARLK